MNRPNTIYKNGRLYGRINSQDQIDLFKKDLNYKNDQGIPAKPEEVNGNFTFARSMYEHGELQLKPRQEHIKRVFEKRKEYYGRKCYNPDDFQLETNTAQILQPEIISRWKLWGSRPENNKLIKIDNMKKNNTYFNIYNRRPNHEQIQTDGPRWLYELEMKPNEFDKYDNRYSLVRKQLNDYGFSNY
jgi:hypothetical protein